jgi:hypothetical protein
MMDWERRASRKHGVALPARELNVLRRLRSLTVVTKCV